MKRYTHRQSIDIRLVYNPFSQFVPQLEVYFQLQLSLWRDPIALGVPYSRLLVLVKIQGAGNQTETQMNKWSDESFSIFWLLEPSEKEKIDTLLFPAQRYILFLDEFTQY